MIRWDARFQTLGPDTAFPEFRNCTVESRRDMSYRSEGIKRRDDVCLFDLTLEGEGVFHDAKGEHPLTPGKAFLCAVNDKETAYYYPPDGKRLWTFLWICFSGGNSKRMLESLVSRYGAVCSMPLESAFVRGLLALKTKAGSICDLNPAESGRMVMELLAAVELAMQSEGRRHASEDMLVNRAQDFILSGLETGTGVAEAAKELCVSREHLSRVFRRRVGMNPLDWMQGRRMALAARLLKDDGLSCKEAAWRLGYISQANFTRAFKKALGMSPSKFKASGAWLPL